MNEEVARVQEPEEEQVSAVPEGRAGGRRGETARQLIRRAKVASRRKFPAEEANVCEGKLLRDPAWTALGLPD